MRFPKVVEKIKHDRATNLSFSGYNADYKLVLSRQDRSHFCSMFSKEITLAEEMLGISLDVLRKVF